jgi:hypothetical protein
MQAIVDYFLYDSLRADGFAVRWSRLSMLTMSTSPILTLCWFMEAMFAFAYYAPNATACRAYAVLFWFAYLMIVWSI